MSTETTAPETTSLSWREIPIERRKAIRAYLKELTEQIRLLRRATRLSQRQMSLNGTPEGILPIWGKDHPLQEWWSAPPEFPRRQRVIPIVKLLETYSLSETSKMFRHLHVAASLARGKSLEQIEPVGKDGKHKENFEPLDKALLSWAKDVIQGTAKLFIVVRNELTPGQRCAQAVHAITAFNMAFPYAPWMNGTIIIKTPPQNSEKRNRTFEAALRGCECASGLFQSYTDSDITAFEGPSAFAYYGPGDSFYAGGCLAEFPLA